MYPSGRQKYKVILGSVTDFRTREDLYLGVHAFSNCFGLLFIHVPTAYASEGCVITDTMQHVVNMQRIARTLTNTKRKVKEM